MQWQYFSRHRINISYRQQLCMDPSYRLKFFNNIQSYGNFNGKYLLYANGNDHRYRLQQIKQCMRNG